MTGVFSGALIVLLLMPIAVLGTHTPQPTKVSSLSLDGIGSNTPCRPANCLAQTLTTTRSHDAVLLIVECGYLNCSSEISSITDNNGLQFTQRISFTQTDRLWEYYAITSSPLKSDNITLVFSDHFSVGGMQALGFSGSNPHWTFDTSPSIAEAASCWNGNYPYIPDTACSASAQTHGTALVIAGTAVNDDGPCTVSASFMTIINTGSFELDYEITSPSSNVVDFNCLNTDPVAIIIDAITNSYDSSPASG